MSLEPRVEREAESWRYAPVALMVIVAWVVLTSPWWSGKWTVPWDAKAHFYPQLQFLARSIWSGESPFWTPNVFSGWPQIADLQDGFTRRRRDTHFTTLTLPSTMVAMTKGFFVMP